MADKLFALHIYNNSINFLIIIILGARIFTYHSVVLFKLNFAFLSRLLTSFMKL